MEPIVPIENAKIFFDGIFSEPRLCHPEGVAIGKGGDLWCGGENGEIYRIAADGSGIELVASTMGFTLGLAFDLDYNLYTCDLKHRAVFKLNARNRDVELFSEGGDDGRMRIPNYPVVDARRNCLYVSDSYHPVRLGPGVWRIDLDSGQSNLWYGRNLRFANGMALSPDSKWLYVAETFDRKVSRIPIFGDGKAGEAEVVVQKIDRLPDGLAFDVEGNLYVACYEPARVYRVSPDNHIELLIEDLDAHTLCHPTNCAFRGTELFTSNLGRWHITHFDTGKPGLDLP